MLDMLIPLIFLLPMAFFYGGIRALAVIGLCVLTCVLTETIWNNFRKRPSGIGDLSSVVTGLLISYMLPAGVPLWMPVAGAIFAVAIVKMPFGGSAHLPFNPAAAAIAFLTVSWPLRMFGYESVMVMKKFTWLQTNLNEAVLSPAAQLKNQAVPEYSLTEMLWGNVPGAIATTGTLVIIACCAYLLYRRISLWMVPVSYVAACAVIALLIPRSAATGLSSVAYELMSGSLLFCAVFLVTDPVTAPKKFFARVIYGATAGFLTMFFRHSNHPGAFEEGACFAVLLVNAASKSMDKLVWKLTQKISYSIEYADDRQKTQGVLESFDTKTVYGEKNEGIEEETEEYPENEHREETEDSWEAVVVSQLSAEASEREKIVSEPESEPEPIQNQDFSSKFDQLQELMKKSYSIEEENSESETEIESEVEVEVEPVPEPDIAEKPAEPMMGGLDEALRIIEQSVSAMDESEQRMPELEPKPIKAPKKKSAAKPKAEEEKKEDIPEPENVEKPEEENLSGWNKISE